MGYFLPKYFIKLCVFSDVNSAWLSFGGSGDQEQSQTYYRIVVSRITGGNWDWLWAFFSQREQCINHFGCVWAAVKSSAALQLETNFVPLEQIFNIPGADQGTSQLFVQSFSRIWGRSYSFGGNAISV